MPFSYAKVVQVALALPGVKEGRSYGTPSLHVGKKFMGRLRDDGETLVIRTSIDDREKLMHSDPDTFHLTDHYRNYPYVLVNLLAIREVDLRRVVERAWRLVASPTLVARHESPK